MSNKRLSRKIHHIHLAFLLLVWLVGCTSPTPTVDISPPPTLTGTSVLSEQINLLATQTQAAVSATSLTPIPSNAETTPILETPSPVVLPNADLIERIGPFQQASREEAMIAGRVIGLQPGEDDSLELISESGYSRYQDGQWTGYFTEEIGALVGIDPAGHAWAAARDGSQIAVWEDDNWRAFGAAEGWSPIPETFGNPVNPGLVIGPDGSLWLATVSDIRRFDGARWQVYTSESMGMPPAQSSDLISSYTLALASLSGELWVGRCDWGGPGPFGGGGVRRFNGQSWAQAGPAINTGCASAIHEDSSGNIWVGVDDSLYRYTSTSAGWEQIPLPTAPTEQRYGFVSSLTTGPAGDVWIALAQCGGASCFVGEDLYKMVGDTWVQVGETSPEGGQRLLFDAQGNTWVLSAGSIHQVVDNTLQPVSGLFVQAAATDSSGNLWLVAQSTGPPTLWMLEP